MLKQFVIYLSLSILIVVFSKYAHMIVVYIDFFFTYINVKLAPIFSPTGWGLSVRKIITLTLLPIVIAAIPAILYKMIRGKELPYFIAIAWIIWIIIVLSDILVRY